MRSCCRVRQAAGRTTLATVIPTDQMIREVCAAAGGGLAIEPFSESLVQPASYDLRVGPQAASASDKRMTNLAAAGFVRIRPGDFVIVATHERLRLDSWHTARFGLTSAYARRGLIATLGAQIDPGFQGRLVVGLTNLSAKPISLPYKDLFLTVEFHRLEQSAAAPYAGPYQGREELAPEDIRAVMEREYMSQTEMMRTLRHLQPDPGSGSRDTGAIPAPAPSCAAVPASSLAAIEILILSYNNRLTSLLAGDFDNLDGVQLLFLDYSYQLPSLPAGIFDNLAALTAALAELRVADALLLRRIQDAARARILLGERIEDIAESIPPRRAGDEGRV